MSTRALTATVLLVVVVVLSLVIMIAYRVATPTDFAAVTLFVSGVAIGFGARHWSK